MPYALILELGIQLVRFYIKSTETKKDDKVFDLVQESYTYLKQNKKI